MSNMRFKQFLKEATHYGSLINQEKYEGLDRHDKALYKYTADGFTSLSTESIEKLLKRYPFEGGEIYRGLHFDDQEEHDAFLAKIATGKLEINSFSSWTTHEKTAEDFAHSKKTYFPTMSIMMAHDQMNKEGEHMSGYGGVVIKTHVEKGAAIDVRKSSFSKEDEVILPAGTYSVEIVKLAEPFKRKYNSIEKIREFLSVLKKAKSKDEEHNKMMDFIVKSWLPKLNEEDADILMRYQLMTFLKMSKEDLKEKYSSFEIDPDYWNKESHRLKFSVYVPVDNRIFDKCSEKLQSTIKKQIQYIAIGAKEKIADVVKNPNIDKIDDFQINGVDGLSHFVPELAKDVTQPLRLILSGRYHSLNSREVSKTLTDQNSMYKHGQKIASIVKAMASL